MALPLMNNSIVVPFGPPRVVAKTSLEQLFRAKKHSSIKSQHNPINKFQFDEYRAMKVKKINKALDEAVPLQHPMVLHEAMRYTLLGGGKRIVAMLCIAACEAIGGNESAAIPLACTMEMITAMSFMQDDLPCLDDDDLRRGKPANHKVFGEGTTLLACQSLICLAIEHIATKTKNVSPDRLLRAIFEICSSTGSEGGMAGQFMDINSEGKETSLSELEFIQRHKCGKLVEASVVSGILVGGGNEVEIERSRNYGKLIGLAYQASNDILDATGTTEELGKKAGRDLKRNKATSTKLMGINEAKKYVKELVAQANEELVSFDSTRAAPLYHLANFMVSRRN